MSGWFGLFGPRGLPKDVLARLNGAMGEALADPTVRKRFVDLGLDVASAEQQTPQDLAAFQAAEIKKWWPRSRGREPAILRPRFRLILYASLIARS